MLADDRTGALDCAAAIARSLGPVPVVTSGAWTNAGGEVVDLDSRATDTADAVERVRTAARPNCHVSLHKIDSMLRGHWVEECRVHADVLGRRLLVVPAWPSMGRVCRAGVVIVDATPVGDAAEQLDARRLILDDLAEWMAGGDGAAVVDAGTDADVSSIARVWLTGKAAVVLAGPAGVLAAAAAAWSDGAAPLDVPHRQRASTETRLDGPITVVCGSQHPMARRQLAKLDNVPDVSVLTTAANRGELHRGAVVRLWSDHERPVPGGVLVLIGGDTAHTVMGPGRFMCVGEVEPGVALSRRADGTGPWFITKAGAFGDDDTLRRVIERIRR